jgi:hypothetical protein
MGGCLGLREGRPLRGCMSRGGFQTRRVQVKHRLKQEPGLTARSCWPCSVLGPIRTLPALRLSGPIDLSTEHPIHFLFITVPPLPAPTISSSPPACPTTLSPGGSPGPPVTSLQGSCRGGGLLPAPWSTALPPCVSLF